jgi:hypothetical protein
MTGMRRTKNSGGRSEFGGKQAPTRHENTNDKDWIGSLEETQGLQNPGMQAHRSSFDKDSVVLCKSAAVSMDSRSNYDYLPHAADRNRWHEP